MSHLIITDNPAKEAGEHINTAIQDHLGDVVCLLAGGSALDIVQYIHPGKHCFHQECHEEGGSDPDEKLLCKRTECRTIFMMGDERVGGEATINNYLQLQERFSGQPILARTIPTVPTTDEDEKMFAARIEKIFLETLAELTNPKIIFILGIGTDGHTAGIFPMEESSFRKIYQDDLTYVHVQLPGLTIDSRASFTPTWILRNADELIGYAVGEEKAEILTKLNTENKKLHERPAELLKLHKRSYVYTDSNIEPEEALEDEDAGY